jgi:ATP-dependent Clp endopeptidase proteolytic subunit ClpP
MKMLNTQLKENTEQLLLQHEYGIDVKGRVVYLIGEFGGECDVIKMTLTNLRFLASPIHFPETYLEPITLVIDSPGGEDIAMFHLYDFITTSKTPIYTVGQGEVCSAAALILVAGEKGHRSATPNCLFMVHKGKSGLGGDDDEVEAQAALQALMSDRYWKLLQRHTELTAAQWFSKSKHKGELWINADTMMEFGVIDSIVPTTKEWPVLSTKKIRTKVKEIEAEEDDE